MRCLGDQPQPRSAPHGAQGGFGGEPPAPGSTVRAVTSPEPAGDLQRHRSYSFCLLWPPCKSKAMGQR